VLIESRDYSKNGFLIRQKPKIEIRKKEITILKKRLKAIPKEHEILKK
jgi:hypothetical protein